MELNFIKNESLAKHTNFRIGGPAKYFFEAKTSDEIVEAVRWASEHSEPYFVLGGGSNVLVADRGFDGLVIKMANRHFVIPSIEEKQVFSVANSVEGSLEVPPLASLGRNIKTIIVSAEAGVLSALLARKTAEAGLTGFEWAVSLPGTIGGAVRGNAGCFGGEMKEVTSYVKIFTSSDLFSDSRESENRLGIERGLGEWRIIDINNTDSVFSYRNSLFKQINPAPIILSAELELKKDDPKKCLERISQNLALRKEKQPLSSSSAGCIFKNFKFQILDFKFNFHAPSEFTKAGFIPAGWLIEQAGLLGLKVGDAEVSTKHGNFVLNRGKATAQNVIDLVQKIKDKVYQKFGTELQEEIQYVGF